MPSGKKGKERKPQRKNKPPGPLSDCKLPHDVFLNILSRLPVKTLLQFRSVCKPWRSLIRSPKFIALHLSHHFSSPSAAATTPYLLLQSVHTPTLDNKLSLFPLQPTPSLSSRTFIDHSLPFFFRDMDVVGIHNGVVCICHPPVGDIISIFNPATRQFAPVQLPPWRPNPTVHGMISIGFGFDPVTDCYKVISIYNVRRGLKGQAEVHVCNCNSGVWKKLEIQGPKISFFFTKCDVVVKGVPYWVAFLEDDYGKRYVLVWFDWQDEVFHHMQMPITGGQAFAFPMDWKGDFAMVCFPIYEEESPFVDFFVIEDDGGGVEWWTKKCSVGPIEGMKSLVGCSRNGQIVGKDGEGNLFLYDPETGTIEYFGIDGNIEHKFAVFNYRESLVSLKGERPIKQILDDMQRHKNRIGPDEKV